LKNITQQTYDQIAPMYAQANAQMPANVLATAQKFLEMGSPDGLYLDLGCGPGQDMAWFGRQQIKIFGADLSAGMLAQARKITARPLVQMNMLALGFAEATFTGIWCSAALLHLPKAEAPLALREMRRVLRPGGLLALFIQQGEGEKLESNPYFDKALRFFARYSLEEMSKILVEAGFSVIETEVIPSERRTWLQFLARNVSRK
jgi:ubiquinone/menaquinone biosynthesis C-methylase UbiE